MVRRLVGEAHFFSFTSAKNFFKTINDKQINVLIAIKRRPNFSIINYSFNLCYSLKATLNVDIIEVFVLAKISCILGKFFKPQKPGFSPTLLFVKNVNNDFYVVTTVFLSTVLLFLN